MLILAQFGNLIDYSFLAKSLWDGAPGNHAVIKGTYWSRITCRDDIEVLKGEHEERAETLSVVEPQDKVSNFSKAKLVKTYGW